MEKIGFINNIILISTTIIAIILIINIVENKSASCILKDIHQLLLISKKINLIFVAEIVDIE